jgi:hypothetical protein
MPLDKYLRLKIAHATNLIGQIKGEGQRDRRIDSAIKRESSANLLNQNMLPSELAWSYS